MNKYFEWLAKLLPTMGQFFGNVGRASLPKTRNPAGSKLIRRAMKHKYGGKSRHMSYTRALELYKSLPG